MQVEMGVKLLSPARWLPVERRVAIASAATAVLLVGILGWGDRVAPRIRSANWAGKQLGARDRVLILAFSRLMDEASVEANLTFDPPLPGRTRWSGRRLIYTLEAPLRYGQTYMLRLPEAQDRQGRSITEPYELQVETRDRQFLAIGTEGKSAGRLIHVNLTQGTAALVTPPELDVSELAVGADGDTVYYFASDRGSARQQLYQLSLSERQSELLLDGDTYQNFRLRVSPDGALAIVERLAPNRRGETELWVRSTPRDRFTPLDLEEATGGGDFSIAPDNNSLIVSQGQGLAIVPLAEDSGTPDFLPQFGQVVAISADGSAAAAVQFNSDFSETLSVVTHTGQRYDLARASGSIHAGAFAPTGTRFYAAIGTADPETYAERPQVTLYDWEARSQSTLVELNYPAELEFDLAPDETALLYSARSLDLGTASEVTQDSDPIESLTSESTQDDLIHVLELGDPAGKDSARQLTLTSIVGRQVTWLP